MPETEFLYKILPNAEAPAFALYIDTDNGVILLSQNKEAIAMLNDIEKILGDISFVRSSHEIRIDCSGSKTAANIIGRWLFDLIAGVSTITYPASFLLIKNKVFYG